SQVRFRRGRQNRSRWAGIGVHVGPEWAFTLRRNRRSRWPGKRTHAESHLEQYQQAIATLNVASLRIDELSDEDKLFLQTLQASCRFQTGQISLAEFSEHLEQVSKQGDNRFALSDRLQRIRYALIDKKQADRSAELLEELRLLVEGITGSP